MTNIYKFDTYPEYVRALATQANMGAYQLMYRCNDYLNRETWEKRKQEHDALEKIIAEGEEK
jgi:hypothetical protein